ncbi:MAG: HAD family hydrolase [Paracoccaceae bacterium]
MTPVRAVVFDIGNVLVEWHPERLYDATIGEDRRRALFAAVDLHGMNERIDLGAPFRDTVYATAEAHPDWAPEIRMWHDCWLEMFAPPIDRSIRLLRALRAAGVPVFALTNFGIDSFALATRHNPVLTEFDRAYVSGHLGLMKPDPAIYAAVEADCGLAPDALLFADDRAENVEAARARGWRAHLFDGPAGWADRLVAEGLLSEGDAA